jgi:hypothetical protein
MSAAQGAAFAALTSGVSQAAVHDHVKQDTQPPFVKIGAIESASDGGKGEQLELITIEVHSIYRGADRTELLAIMHEVRQALDDQAISAPGASFQRPKFVRAAVSDAGPDGATYAGISIFEFHAEPA